MKKHSLSPHCSLAIIDMKYTKVVAGAEMHVLQSLECWDRQWWQHQLLICPQKTGSDIKDSYETEESGKKGLGRGLEEEINGLAENVVHPIIGLPARHLVPGEITIKLNMIYNMLDG